jgi:hypothetical protein
MRICTRGYEGGFYDLTVVQEILIVENVNTNSYWGPHAESDDIGVPENAPSIKVLLI